MEMSINDIQSIQILHGFFIFHGNWLCLSHLVWFPNFKFLLNPLILLILHVHNAKQVQVSDWKALEDVGRKVRCRDEF